MEESTNYVPLREDWDNEELTQQYIDSYEVSTSQRVTAGCLAFIVLSGIILSGTVITLGIINLLTK